MVYFPLIVPECLIAEPTETEIQAVLDESTDVMKGIAELAERDPEALHQMPRGTPGRPVDEVRAARYPVLSHTVRSAWFSASSVRAAARRCRFSCVFEKPRLRRESGRSNRLS